MEGQTQKNSILTQLGLFPGEQCLLSTMMMMMMTMGRRDELIRAVDRLALISAQDAIILPVTSFSAPRTQHLMRCSLSVDNTSLQIFMTF